MKPTPIDLNALRLTDLDVRQSKVQSAMLGQPWQAGGGFAGTALTWLLARDGFFRSAAAAPAADSDGTRRPDRDASRVRSRPQRESHRTAVAPRSPGRTETPARRPPSMPLRHQLLAIITICPCESPSRNASDRFRATVPI